MSDTNDSETGGSELCDGCQKRESKHEYGDDSSYCEECHVANLDAAGVGVPDVE